MVMLELSRALTRARTTSRAQDCAYFSKFAASNCNHVSPKFIILHIYNTVLLLIYA